MTERDGAARLMIVCGLPGSGKTTHARRLEAAHGGVRFCPDEWIDALGIDLFDEPARARVEQLQWVLAQRLLSLGVPVVIEWGTWNRYERDALRQAARTMGVAVELHFLDAPVDELWARVAERDGDLRAGQRALTRDDIALYDTMIQRPDAEELALFDPPTGPV
jgi:predicted kinase